MKPVIISIHALREEGDPADKDYTESGKISIHALREEGDGYLPSCISHIRYFYPRPPRGGRRIVEVVFKFSKKFLSTPSARRATVLDPAKHTTEMNFYPRPPRGGRPSRWRWKRRGKKRFLSTPSARRATAKTEKNISAFVSL